MVNDCLRQLHDIVDFVLLCSSQFHVLKAHFMSLRRRHVSFAAKVFTKTKSLKCPAKSVILVRRLKILVLQALWNVKVTLYF